jgi:hypothetical protein
MPMLEGAIVFYKTKSDVNQTQANTTIPIIKVDDE